MDPATVVIDNGTGYTKMGYAGNMEPSYLIPSIIAKSIPKVSQLLVCAGLATSSGQKRDSRGLLCFATVADAIWCSKRASDRRTTSTTRSSTSSSERRPSPSRRPIM